MIGALINQLLYRGVLQRRLLLLAWDGLLIATCFWLSFALRLGEPVPLMLLPNLYLLPWAVVIGLSVLVFSGWYRGLTRYSGSHSLYALLPRSGLMVLLLLLVSTLASRGMPPFRGFWLLFWLLFSGAAIASRIVLRDLLRWWLSRPAPARPAGRGRTEGGVQPVLVYVFGLAADQLVAQLKLENGRGIAAVVSDDPTLVGRSLRGLPIHPMADLPALAERFHTRDLVFAEADLPRPRRRQLVERLTEMDLRVLSIPSVQQIRSGERVISSLKPVVIEDLLGRDASCADPTLLQNAVAGKVVLVSGAGGSIGSELCRQIAALGASRLVMLERSEEALYDLDISMERLRQTLPDLDPGRLEFLLGDVCDRDRLASLCRQHGVQVLFHAAAYKHVPLVERNICAGVANNVGGTRSALEAAIASGVERFILISTDKAVRPTNAMGASKRVAEMLVQLAARRGTTTVCAMVRFGNVLGSSGSVVPRFRAQIKAGGPITVTHPEITRYFMTIPEAVALVLQASGMAEGGRCSCSTWASR